ncbi:MAG: AraC family transcriptional regulator [Paenibacillaceae bacterium]|jgi:AraC-like DNA-binding protein|nr:AraC family transcriptional regulator [Paenibacillaceae bacterium]
MSRSPHILAFLLAPGSPDSLPLRLQSLGRHDQTHIYRPKGIPHGQLLWSSEGNGHFEFPEAGEFSLPAGCALYLPGDMPHEYSPRNGPWLLSFLSFEGPAAENIARSCGMLPCTPFSLGEAEGVLRSGLEEMWLDIQQGAEEAERRYSSRLYSMLLAAGEAALASRAPLKPDEYPLKGRNTPAGTAPADLALRQALRLLDQHYTEQLDMSNLARTVGYSVQHFQRIFKQACGMSPYVYLQRMRLHRSLEWLMEEPLLSVREIAARLGWEANYYIRVFREHFGMAPGQYRRTGEHAKSPPHHPEEEEG